MKGGVIGEMTKKQREEIKRLKETLKKVLNVKKTNEKSNSNTRLILERDNFKCKICGDSKIQLDIHHLIPKEFGGKHKQNNLITLCKSCHMFMHCNPKLTLRSKQGMSNAIKQGLAKRKKQGKPLGRQKGAKDKKKRDNLGYFKF